ncbi:putative leucine-rich repeat-containing protein DDB_G0290503 isoform X1 [Nilaparvata lugens]|uniref:putative leucine-rich repeat-containing protein DDB_G0290503 isoform X1 n=1 Tax=Nilaparvata lugens TaxID=108931 RepID=UPI00193D0EC8|nr:putative leucine-rich repeat-containing protein DDB_G0290503 isoform X1 [Nilaparvata lugens]
MEDDGIHHSRKKVTPTEDEKVEHNDDFLAEVNEEKVEDIKRAGELLKEENPLLEVIKEDIGLENKEAINNFENLSKSDSPVEVEGMNKHIENVGKDGVEKHSDEVSNFVDDERVDYSNKCSDNQSEIQSENNLIHENSVENTLKQTNITDEVFNEECILLSVKHLSFDSEFNQLYKEEHVVDEVDRIDIDDNTLFDGDSTNQSPTSENVIIDPLKDETLISGKPVENTVLENLDEVRTILGQDTADDKKEEMPNKNLDEINNSLVSGLAPPSVQGSTLGKEFLEIQNEVESKSDHSLNSITGEEVASNIGIINEDHVNVTGSEPLVDIDPSSEVLAEIDTTRNIEEKVLKLEIVEQYDDDDDQKSPSSVLEPIIEQINVTPSQTDIVSVTGGRTEEATDCIPAENKPENDENIVGVVVLEVALVGPSMVIEKNGENNDEGKKEHLIIMNNDTSVPCNNTETLIEKNNLESVGSDTKVDQITQNELIESQLENELLENEKNENFVNKMKADVSVVMLSTENVSNVTDGTSGAPVTEHQKSEEDVIAENFEGNRNENLKMNISEKLDDNNEILEVEYTDLNIVSTSEEALSKSNEDDNANETLESENDLLVKDNGERDENEVIDDKPSESTVNVINEEENKSEILENSGINIPLALEQDVLFDSNEQKICDDVKIASDEIENSLIEKEQHPFGEDGTSCSKTGADESNDNECFTKGDPSSENEEPAETLQNDKLIIGTVSRIILGVVGMDIGTNIEQVSEISINIANDSNEKIFKSPEVKNIDSIGTNSVDCLRNDTSDNNEQDFVGSDENKSTNVEDFIQEQIIIADIGGAKSDLNIIDSEENKTLTDEARADAVQEGLSKSTEDQLSMGDSNVTEVLNNNKKILSKGIRLLNKSDIANAAEENKGEIDDMAIIQDPETFNSGGEFLKKDVDEQKESYFETGEGVEDLVGDTEGTRHIETGDKIEEKSSNDEESNEVDESTNDNIIEKIHENLEVIKDEEIFDESREEFDLDKDRNKEHQETAVTETTEKDVIDEKCQNKEIGALDTGIDPITVEGTSRENISSNSSDTGVDKIIPSIEPLQITEIATTTNSCGDSSNIESCQIERDELLVVCDTDENNMLQFDHNSECTEPPNETGMHTLEENVIHNIDKETVITEDNIPQVFETANQNANEKNTEIDNLEECPQIVQNDNKDTTELINRVECSLENRTFKECSVEDESHIIEHEIKIDKNLENNGGESEKRKNENFTEDEAFIHGNQRSPVVDNNNIVSSKEESEELIIKADANSEVTEDSEVTIGRGSDDSAKESEIMEAVENSITETVERRVITELNEGITENTVSVIETYENGKEANKVEDFKIQYNLNEIGENVRDPSDKIVIEQELQENTSSITEEDLEEKIKSEDVIIEQMNLKIEKIEQCIDLQQNDIEMVVENTNDISYSIDTIEESSIVKEDDEIPKNELRIIESSKDEHVHESQHENPIIDIPTEDRSHENSKGGLEQSDEVCVPLNGTTVEQNKSLENSVKEGISTNEEMPEYDKSVQEIIVVNESENTEMEIEGNRENNVLDFDIDSNSKAMMELVMRSF